MKSDTNSQDFRRYYAILELEPSASLTDIRKAYIRLKELYSTESLAILAVEDEVPDDHKAQILSKIQEAYHRLRSRLEDDEQNTNGHKVTSDKVVLSKVAELEKQTYSGANLKRIREELKIGLDAVASGTRVPLPSLENIEQENFEELPAEVFTRGFVVAYARHLALDVETVVADYMQRYSDWKSVQAKKPRSRLLARLTGKT